MQYKDLYDWMLKAYNLDNTKINELRRAEKVNNISDVQVAIDSKIASISDIDRALHIIYNLSIYDGDCNDVQLLENISLTDMCEKRFIAFWSGESLKNKFITVLITSPKTKVIVSDLIKAQYPNYKSVFKVIVDDKFNAWKQAHSEEISNNEILDLTSSIDTVDDTDPTDDIIYSDLDDKNLSGIMNTVNTIIISGAKHGASDIHIEPHSDGTHIRERIDGVLRPRGSIADKNLAKQVVNRLKVMSQLDTNNSKETQSGKIKFTPKDYSPIDIRVSTLPTIYGEKVTLRLLTESDNRIRTLEKLGVTTENCRLLRKMISHPNGIILISGPTGSGKSSTLAALMSELDKPENCLITIEDPVEYRIPGAVQVNVNNAMGITFAKVLRETLRQDPDIIMVGEIRDLETAQIAVTASNTGHLVLSTIHTNSAVGTLGRLRDIGVDSYMVADNLIGIINQQLVRKLCPYCREEYIISNEDIEKYKLPKSLVGKTAYKAKSGGCAHCDSIGYKGRTVITEVMYMSDDIVNLIHSGGTMQEIEEAAKESKFPLVTKLDSAVDLLLNGTTTMTEIRRVLGGFDL